MSGKCGIRSRTTRIISSFSMSSRGVIFFYPPFVYRLQADIVVVQSAQPIKTEEETAMVSVVALHLVASLFLAGDISFALQPALQDTLSKGEAMSVALPAPRTDGSISVEQALSARRWRKPHRLGCNRSTGTTGYKRNLLDPSDLRPQPDEHTRAAAEISSAITVQ